MKLHLLICYLILLGLLTPTFAQTDIYVDANKTSSGNGSSWTQAYNNLNQALVFVNSKHASDTTAIVVHIAQGTYKPDDQTFDGEPFSSKREYLTGKINTGLLGASEGLVNPMAPIASIVTVAIGQQPPYPSLDTKVESVTKPRHETFALKRSNLKILGGYNASTGERNISSFPTILDGDLGSYKAYHVMTIGTYDDGFMEDSLIIDGITFQNGQADGTGWVYGSGFGVPESKGGALSILFTENAQNTDKLAIRNCTFSNNNAIYGGAIYAQFCDGEVSNCSFQNSSSSAAGGAVLNFSGGTDFKSCSFSNSTSPLGGATYQHISDGNFEDCTFSNNSSTLLGGVLFCNLSDFHMNSCTFTNNSSAESAGALCHFFSSVIIDECTFNGNSSSNFAGSIFSYHSNTGLRSTSFENESATLRGGALFYRGNKGKSVISSCSFTNISTSDSTNSNEGLGGVLLADSSAILDFNNSTFNGNYSYRSGIAYVTVNSVIDFNSCEFMNNLAHYSTPISRNFESSVTYRFCRFENNDCNTKLTPQTNFGLLGGVFKNNGTLNFHRCIFDGNDSHNTSSSNTSSIIYNFDTLFIDNSVFANNLVDYGAVIYNWNNAESKTLSSSFYQNGGFGATFSGLSGSNTIVYNSALDDKSFFIRTDATYDVKNVYSSFGIATDIGSGSTESFMNSDPQFVSTDYDGIDNILGTNDDGMRLSASSPGIGYGNANLETDTTSDILGNSRISNGSMDIGAYEYYLQVPGQSLTFNGTNEYITIPSFTPYTEQTIEIKAKPTIQSTDQYILSWSGSNGAYFGIDDEGYLFYETSSRTTANTKIADTTWQHLSFTKFNDGTIHLFLNGILVGEGIHTETISNSATYIGTKNAQTGHYQGVIDNMVVWSKARCGEEINSTKNYTHWFTNINNLERVYNFNQGLGDASNIGQTSLLDAGVSSLHGTLTNFNLTDNSNWTSISSPFVGGLNNEVTVQQINAGIDDTYFNVGDTAFLTASVPAWPFEPELRAYYDTYEWTGPNGFTSNQQNPTINRMTFDKVGLYTVVASSNGCSSMDTVRITMTEVDANSIVFDGNNSISCPFNQLPSQYAFEARIKVGSTLRNNPIVTWIGANNEYQALYINSSGYLVFEEVLGATNNTIVASTFAVNDLAWHHITLSKSSNATDNVTIYVDGNSVGTMTSAISPTTTQCLIGQWELNSSFIGKMDEVRIWNKSLCSEEANQYVNDRVSHNIAGLEVLYNFNQGISGGDNSALSVVDSAGTAQNGTPQNFELSGGLEANFIREFDAFNEFTQNNTAFNSGAISISGNNSVITTGDETPSILDLTDFGNVVLGTSNTATFYIKNTGNQPLFNIFASVEGADNSYFTESLPTSSLSAGDSMALQVVFAPGTEAKVREATIKVSSSYCYIPEYTFNIKGKGGQETGPAGQSLHFDKSTTNQVVLINESIGTSDAFTYEASFKFEDNLGTVFSQEGNIYSVTGEPYYSKLFISNDKLCYSESPGNIICSGTLSQGQWYHGAVTRQTGSDQTKLYVDGTQVAQGTMSSTADYTLARIGNTFDEDNFSGYKGQIDELRVWNKALCNLEIQNAMSCEIDSLEANLLAYYNFNQGLGGNSANIANNTSISILNDASLNGHDGAINNLPLIFDSGNFLLDGAVTTGNVCSSYQFADISVSSNNIVIANGDNTPDLADNTNLGSIDFSTNPIVKQFSIANIGSGNLNLTNATRVTLTGAPEFTLSQDASSPIAASQASTFSISFTPTSVGTFNGQISIVSDDCDEPLYSFSISGMGTAGTPTGRTIDLDGVGHLENTSPTNLPTGDSPYTIEFMIKPDASGAPFFMGILSWGNDATNQLTEAYIRNGTFYHSWDDGSPQTVITAPYDGNWHHVAMTYDGQSRKTYYDGELKTSENKTSHNATTGSSLFVGKVNNATVSSNLQGQLDEVRVWNKALCQGEIVNGMAKELVGSQAGLVAYYQFNQGIDGLNNSTETTAIDASSSGNTLTLSGLPLNGTSGNWVAPGAVENGAVAGVFNGGTMEISGNGTTIANGSTTTNTNDETNFGNVNANSSPETHYFQIKNLSAHQLVYYGTPIVTVTGTGFSLAQDASPNGVSGGASDVFGINFVPTDASVHNGTVTIRSNDCSNETYTFAISGTGVEPVLANVLTLDGIDDYINTYATTNISNSLTYEAQIFLKNSPQEGAGIISSESTSGGAAELLLTADGYLLGQITDNDGTTLRSVKGSTLLLNQWYQVAMTYDGNEIKLFVDGEPETLTNVQNGAISSCTFDKSMLVGTNKSKTIYAPIIIDEMRVYKVALCPAEISAVSDCYRPSYHDFGAGYRFISPEKLNLTTFNFESAKDGANNSIYNEAGGYGTISAEGALNNFSLIGFESNWVYEEVNKLSGTCSFDFQSAVAEVSGNGTVITNNDNTPSYSDSTNFGYVERFQTVTRTYTISNVGDAGSNLNIFGTPRVQVTGTGFSLAQDADAIVASGNSTTFKIQFAPYQENVSTGQVTISYDGCSSETFTFDIQGSSIPASALAFDGIDDKVTIPNQSTLEFNTGTVEMWVKASSSPFTKCLAAMRNGPNNRWSILMNEQSNLIGIQTTSNSFQSVSTNINPNEYYHIAVVFGMSSSNIYVNGLYTGSIPFSIDAGQLNHPLTIGHSNDPSFSIQYFNGSIDEVRIWSRELCGKEIAHRYQSELNELDRQGLVAYYPFNQGGQDVTNNENMLVDQSSNGFNGTLNNFSLSGQGSNWTSDGAVIAGLQSEIFFPSDLDVYGNGIEILEGNSQTSLNNYTAFDSTETPGSFSSTRTYTVSNNGLQPLSFTNSPKVTVSGTAFTLISDLPAQLAPGQSASFEVSFDPVVTGLNTGSISIGTDICDASDFTYSISGIGLEGPPANALHFDGVNDYVEINNPYTAFTNEITVEWWVKVESMQTGAGISQGTPSQDNLSTNVWMMHGNPDNSFWFIGVDQSNNWGGFANSGILSNGWHHITGVATTEYTKIYVDGVLKDNVAGVPNGINVNSLSKIHFGKDIRYSDRFLKGEIDEVRIWNRARDINEINATMNCEIDPNSEGLVGYYRFDEGREQSDNSGVTNLNDYSTTNSTPTLNNFNLNGIESNFVNPGAVVSGSQCAPCILYGAEDIVSCTPILSSNGTPLNVSGTYIDTLDSPSFCDSVITINFSLIENTLTDFTLNGENDECSGENSELTLSGSEGGINYFLRNTADSSIIDGPLNGNGNGLSFDANNLSETTTYHVYGETDGTADIDSTALKFNGFAEFVILPSTVNSELSTEVTVEGWFYPQAYTGGISAFVTEGFSGDGNVEFAIYLENGQLNAGFYNGVWRQASTPQPAYDNWIHIAATYDQNTIKLYLNGVLVNSVQYTGALPSGTEDWYIGRRWDFPEYYVGQMDEIRIWNYARSQEQINSMMSNPAHGAELGLVAYYNFESGIGTTLLEDASTNNYTGTILNTEASDWVDGVLNEYTPKTCNEVVSNDFVINVLPAFNTSIDESGALLTSNDSSGTTNYQWVDCDNSYAPILGEVNNEYEATTLGNYAVILSNNACADTTSCIEVIITNNSLYSNNNILSVFPNPTLDIVNIGLKEVSSPYQVSVINSEGKVTQSFKSKYLNFKVNLIEEPEGLYLIKIETLEETYFTKVVKR